MSLKEAGFLLEHLVRILERSGCLLEVLIHLFELLLGLLELPVLLEHAGGFWSRFYSPFNTVLKCTVFY